MNKSTIISSAILTMILLLVLGTIMFFGGSLAYFYVYGVMDLVYDVLLVLIGIVLVISVIPLLISSFIQFQKSDKGKADMILSLIVVLIGIVFVCFGIVSELLMMFSKQMVNVFLELKLRLSGESVSIDDKWYMVEQVMRFPRHIRWLLTLPASLYLMIAPLLRMTFTKDRGLQYRVEICKPFLGLLVLIMTVLGAVIDLVGRPVAVVIEVLAVVVVVFAIVQLMVGLVGLSKAIRRRAERAEQAKQATLSRQEAQLSEDWLMDLPAGVSAEDFYK